jgi:hypothetical protein
MALASEGGGVGTVVVTKCHSEMARASMCEDVSGRAWIVGVVVGSTVVVVTSIRSRADC